jgi:hypothetical protein
MSGHGRPTAPRPRCGAAGRLADTADLGGALGDSARPLSAGRSASQLAPVSTLATCPDAPRSLTLYAMWERATLKSILIGLVSGLLLAYIVRPILERIPAWVLYVANATSQGWANLIYIDAASAPSFEGLLIVMIALVPVTAGILVLGHLTHVPAEPRSRRRLFSAGFVSSLSVPLLFLGSLRSSSATLSQCFHLSVTVLAPHITDQEVKQLNASWALMRTRSDFDAINKTMVEQARKYNVTALIPKPAAPARRCPAR